MANRRAGSSGFSTNGKTPRHSIFSKVRKRKIEGCNFAYQRNLQYRNSAIFAQSAARLEITTGKVTDTLFYELQNLIQNAP